MFHMLRVIQLLLPTECQEVKKRHNDAGSLVLRYIALHSEVVVLQEFRGGGRMKIRILKLKYSVISSGRSHRITAVVWC